MNREQMEKARKELNNMQSLMSIQGRETISTNKFNAITIALAAIDALLNAGEDRSIQEKSRKVI